MATFKPEVQNKRADGTYNVRIRVTHNRTVRRISTNIYVTSEDLTRSLKIKNQKILDKCEPLLKKCRDACNDLGFSINNIDIYSLVELLKNKLEGGDRFNLEFMQYTRDKAAKMNKSTGNVYINTLSAIERYIKRTELDISEINGTFLKGFEQFLENKPSQRGNNRKKKN